jgi:nucleotide-binding universal stress UspA family protein
MSQSLHRILVPIDGSQTAGRAVGVAIGLGLRHRAELVFCTSVNHAVATAECATPYGAINPLPLLEVLDENARDVVLDAKKRAQDAGVSASTALLDGPPSSAIVTYAESRPFDAIVMGTQGKHGLERVLLGSTAEGVLRSTTIPTFVVHPGADVQTPVFRRILVAVDDSEPSAAACAFTYRLASVDDSRLLLCNVVESAVLSDNARLPGYGMTPFAEHLRGGQRSLDKAGEEARANGIDVDTVKVEGQPVDQLLWAAQSLGADLIAIGTHGRRGLKRLIIGSVAEGVVRRSPIPVVVVRVAQAHSTLEGHGRREGRTEGSRRETPTPAR